MGICEIRWTGKENFKVTRIEIYIQKRRKNRITLTLEEGWVNRLKRNYQGNERIIM